MTKLPHRGWKIWVLGQGRGSMFYDLADPMVSSAPLPGHVAGPFEGQEEAIQAARVEIDRRCDVEAEACLLSSMNLAEVVEA